MGRVTNEQAEEMTRRYKAGERAEALAAEYGITLRCVYYHVSRNRKTTPGKCPKCRSKFPAIKRMVYCPFCAADVRTPSARAAENLLKMTHVITTYYPANLRDEAIAALNEAIKILEEV